MASIKSCTVCKCSPEPELFELLILVFFMRFNYPVFLFVSLICFFSLQANAQDPLPKWMTEAEQAIYGTYKKELPEPTNITPPENPPRTPAEFEELEAIIITWASYSSELREIVGYAQSAVSVYIITSDPGWVENYLASGNVPIDNIYFIEAPFNSVWVRDYGPQSVYLDGTDDLAFIDWDYNRPRPYDNMIPQLLAEYLDLPVYQMAYDSSLLTATGGNFMTDGHGTGFSSRLILTENPHLSEDQIDQVMHSFKGIDRYIKMDELPYDNISHLDMHMKLLDEETLLVGEFPEGISDGPFIEANLEYLLGNYQSCYDRPYNIVRIPMAPSPSGNYPPNAHYRTYTNSLILNNLVLVPVYGSYLDDVALEIYQEAMPGYEIIGINMNNVISASGAIHCITREIAATDPVFIAHARLRADETSGNDHEIKAYISSQSDIEQAAVYWTTDPDAGFYAQEMIQENDTFYTYIPAQSASTEVFYYISATNGNNKTISKPPVAPEGYYSFSVATDETHSPVAESPLRHKVYPNPGNGLLSLSLSPFSSPVNLVIADMRGQIVYRHQLPVSQTENLQHIDLRHEGPGIYILHLSNSAKTITEKIIIH